MPAVFCGCLIFNIVKRGISEKIDAKSKKILGNTILFGTLTLIILVMFSNMKYSIILWDIFWGIILFSQFIHENNIIANPFVTAIGKLSYEIYLFHILLIESIKKIPVFSSNDLLDWGGKFILLVAISVLLGMLYNRFIEIISGKIFPKVLKHKE